MFLLTDRSHAYHTQLRCSGRHPNCDRCTRLKKVCSYGAAHSVNFQIPIRSSKSATIETLAPIIDDEPVSSFTLSQVTGQNYRERTASERRPLEVKLSELARFKVEQDLQLPFQDILMFIRIYFNYAYNATLLFDEEKLWKSLLHDKVPKEALFSIFASASRLTHNGCFLS